MALDLRPSSIAGTWYEGDPAALRRSVDHHLDHASLPPLEGELLGVIAPHAGHVYSGPVAGHAFAAVRGRRPQVVALLSPFHEYHPSPLLVTSHEAYETPLGAVPVDRELLQKLEAELQASGGMRLQSIARDREHSLEIELPFLQRALAAPFRLLPLMVRVMDPGASMALGSALVEALKDTDALLVGSTDLSHFYDQRTAGILDAEMLRQIEDFSIQGMFTAEYSGKGFACGLGAVAAVLWAARLMGADRVQVLKHATSGDVTGDYEKVVGYAAAAILKSRPA